MLGDGAVWMGEHLRPPGESTTLPTPDLVLRQAADQPFRYSCDLGSGRFSGHAQPMDFVAVPPESGTWCRIEARSRLRVFGIRGDRVRSCLDLDPGEAPDFGTLHASHQHDPLVLQALEMLWQEPSHPAPHSRLFVDALVATLVLRLARLGELRAPTPACRGGLAPRQSARVIEYLHAHLAQRVTLAELAAVAGLSPSHFAHAFRATHGEAPHRYLTGLRIRRARQLLAHTDMPVIEIAAAIGYSAPQLARHFREATGTTPGEYRRRLRNRH